jgi:hypothetical protein
MTQFYVSANKVYNPEKSTKKKYDSTEQQVSAANDCAEPS